MQDEPLLILEVSLARLLYNTFVSVIAYIHQIATKKISLINLIVTLTLHSRNYIPILILDIISLHGQTITSKLCRHPSSRPRTNYNLTMPYIVGAAAILY